MSYGGAPVQLTYAIVFVSDMKRSVSFYRDDLGLSLKFESPEWSEFATGEATLALHSSRGPAGGADADDLPAGRCRPGFAVPDLDAFHRRMIERGVPCIREPEDVGGARVAGYADPDGLSVSVGEARGAE
jgi:lactoylglutathione lyase